MQKYITCPQRGVHLHPPLPPLDPPLHSTLQRFVVNALWYALLTLGLRCCNLRQHSHPMFHACLEQIWQENLPMFGYSAHPNCWLEDGMWYVFRFYCSNFCNNTAFGSCGYFNLPIVRSQRQISSIHLHVLIALCTCTRLFELNARMW